ncbi:MAG: hypothetical protein Q8P01_05455, partial [bacterium]|nr:hypothetical protein [bacterium]
MADLILRRVGKVCLLAQEKPNDPGQFFQVGPGLWVSKEFADWILSAAKPVVVPETVIASFDLMRPAKDAKIRAALPAEHLFGDVSAFCAYLEGMLHRQANGEEGDLLVNGFMSVFYLCVCGEVFAVHVHWFSDHRQWYVYVFHLLDTRWTDG